MKNTEIFYLNDNHQGIIENHISNIKQVMYFATEDVSSGKYQDFLQILRSVYMYSNNFYDTILNKSEDEGVMSEFIFLIPNMTFYTAIGFLTALKDGDNNSDLQSYLEQIGKYCENATSELADILIDKKEENKLLKDIKDIELSQN
tara:strand:+ start:32 stop:469 length:438 start_codon:yes stop_codon:yes gene_type:complete